MERFEKELLAKVAAVPVGEKLPLSRIARELDCSISVVISGVAALVLSGALDEKTVRPPQPVRGQAASAPGEVSALLAECEAFLQRTGMAQSTLGKRAAGSYSFVANLRNARHGPRPATAARVRQFMADFEARPTPIAAPPIPARGEAAPVPGADVEVGAATAREDRAAPTESIAARADNQAPRENERPTGRQLHDEIMAFIVAADGLSVHQFAALLGRSSTSLANIAKANFPKPETVAKVRAIIAGDRAPFVPIDGVTLPRARSANAVINRNVDGLRACADAAAARRRPGETLADAVSREAEESSSRRMRAFNPHPHAVPETNRERLARLAAEVEAEERASGAAAREAFGGAAVGRTDEERERDLDELASPSSVLRRAQRDWPGQCERVKAIAGELGVGLGEAWRRVIAAGVDCLVEAEA